MAAPVDVQTPLGRIAKTFEEAASAESGWSQFLDTVKRHNHAGLYGTSAGLISLSLAHRDSGIVHSGAVEQLRQRWTSADTLGVQQRLGQNIRLAFLNLALSFCGKEKQFHREVRSELLARLLPTKMWGNYWVDDGTHDPTPRVFPSSLALLSLVWNRQREPTRQLQEVADAIEAQVLSTSIPEEFVLGALAVLACKRKSRSPALARHLARHALREALDLSRDGIYFFDYEYSSLQNEPFWGRDYFRLPLEIPLAIAGFQLGAPPSLRLRAEEVVRRVVEDIAERSAARLGHFDRLSTVDQAWASLLLGAAGQAWEAADSPQSLGDRIKYALMKHRQDGRLSKAFPFIAVLAMTGISVLTRQAEVWLHVLSTLALVCVTSYYGADTIRRLVPWKK